MIRSRLRRRWPASTYADVVTFIPTRTPTTPPHLHGNIIILVISRHLFSRGHDDSADDDARSDADSAMTGGHDDSTVDASIGPDDSAMDVASGQNDRRQDDVDQDEHDMSIWVMAHVCMGYGSVNVSHTIHPRM